MGKIRLLLALSVVAVHGGIIWKFQLVGGHIAVQTFFIISGFYMSMILNEKYVGSNSSYKLFISNRFLRLYPIYWAVLLFTLLLFVFFEVANHGQPLSPHLQDLTHFNAYTDTRPGFLSFLYLIIIHIVILGQDAIMFLGISTKNGSLHFVTDFSKTHPQLWTYLFIPQAWSLSLEITFYLIAPFILRRGLKVVLPLILVSLMLRFFIYDYLGFPDDPWSRRFFPTELLFFLLGYLSYRFYLTIGKKDISKNLNLFVLCVTVMFIVAYKAIPAVRIPYVPFSIRDIAFFATMSFSIPILFNYDKKNKLDNRIGELSYPVYIVHYVVIVLMGIAFTNIPGWLIVTITILVSYLLNKFIASPIEKYRQRRLKKVSVRT